MRLRLREDGLGQTVASERVSASRRTEDLWGGSLFEGDHPICFRSWLDFEGISAFQSEEDRRFPQRAGFGDDPGRWAHPYGVSKEETGQNILPL